MRLIGKGKAKDIYLDDSGDVIFEFTDRVTAFDGAKKAEYPHKGNYVAGSLWRRHEKGELKLPEDTEAREGAPIPNGILEFTTKFEAVDRPVNTKELIYEGWMTEMELKYISEVTEKVNDIMFCRLHYDF